ncbi:MAG: nucleotidyltransferase domain-containing protein [Methanofollis sp.]|uniref:nucleotidyltransferase domain-containing protein n=1 Tax=Methanofollis sp. TaxID=2052835 RepID=UPI00262C630F|nr:nucleotidyltransferase domain-containing protein [Methanofollis sp.]MDD4256130.1 nucleotidyltransferase domain-containing protein [Methanofollis sp.]
MSVIERLQRVEGFERVRFVILYGSASRGEEREDSDIDLCVFFNGDREEASHFRFRALSELFSDRYDLQIFQQLPLYVRVESLRGQVLYCPDEQFLYDVAVETIREFDAFKHRLYDYIGERAIP